MKIIANKSFYNSSYEQLTLKRLAYLRLKLFYRFLRKEGLYLSFTKALPKQKYEYRRDLKASSFNMWTVIIKMLSNGTIDEYFNELVQIVEFKEILKGDAYNLMRLKFNDLIKEYGLQVGKIE